MPGRNPSSPTDRRKNPARSKDRRAPASPKRVYRVVPHGERWNIERDGKATGLFADDLDTAVRMATAKAEQDVRGGTAASVCVQEKDGTSRQIWP